MSETKTRTLHFSVEGEFINKLALEQCHIENRVGYAFQLIRDVTMREGQTEAESIKLALDILDGKLKIKGVYPGDDYRIEPAGPNDHKYSVLETLNKMESELKQAKADLELMNRKMVCIVDYLDDEAMLRAINRHWQDNFDEDGVIFLQDTPAQNSYLGHRDGIFDRMLTRTPFVPAKTDDMLSDYIQHMQTARDDDYGWLAPDGTFYPAEWGNHTEWAFNYCQEHKPYDWGDDKKATHFLSAGDFLSKHGWVLLHNPAQGTAIVTTPFNETTSLTKAQREFLYGYYIDRNQANLAEKYIRED